jgi:hypothetical protein
MMFTGAELKDMATRATDEQVASIFAAACARSKAEALACVPFTPTSGAYGHSFTEWVSAHTANQICQNDDIIIAFGEEHLRRKGG